MEPIFFASSEAFRTWLTKNHAKAAELWVGYYKTHTKKPSLTWSQSVDQALCFGWIDGIRRSIGPDSYMIRFTPRRPGSIWSTVNINKMKELTKQGLVNEAGKKAFAVRKEERSSVYSFDQEIEKARLPKEFEKQFKANKVAWKHWQVRPNHYRKNAIWHVVSAKQEETKKRRLQQLINDSAQFPTYKDMRLHYTKRWL